MYSHVRIVYIIFTLVTLAVLLWSGVKMSRTKTDKGYWHFAWPAIIMYTLYMGLRFGRNIDYNDYAVTYSNMAHDLSYNNMEPLFRAIVFVLTSLGLHFQFFILFCAFILIYAVMHFLKDYKPAMPYMLILFMWEGRTADNFIRWYIAVAFLLIFIYFLRKGNPLLYVFALAAIGCHYGIFILVLALYLLNKVKIVPLPAFVWQILLIASVFLGKVGVLSFISPYISFLGIDERTSGYVARYDDIVAGDFGRMGIHDSQPTTYLLRLIIAYSFPIWMIATLIKEKVITHLDANCYLIGIVAHPICNQVEILGRFSQGFLLFSVIVSGCAYWYVFKNARRYNNMWVCFAAVSLFCFAGAILYQHLFLKTGWWEMLYIWDAHGRETIPFDYYQGLKK